MLLTTVDCDALLAAALPAYGFTRAADVRLLSLSENGTYRVREGGRTVVARVHRHGYQDAASIASEMAWTDALRTQVGVRTPAVVPTLDGRRFTTIRRPEGDRHVALFEHVAGANGEETDLPLPVAELGALTARMHGQVEAWRLPDGFRRFRWDAAACLGTGDGRDARWGSWRDVPGLAAAAVPLLAEAAEHVAERLADYGTGPDRFGLVHADLRLANLMIDDAGGITVIDFDDCGFGWFLYDLATVTSWLEHEESTPATVAEWVAGYTTVRPLTDADHAMVPTFVLLRRLMLSAWLGTHPDSPPAQQLGTSYAAGTVLLADRYLHDPSWLAVGAPA
ncbi:phosphotransferase [Nocardioides sp. ChNu-99]|uniref:phosphotransferase enzyme family protein n=1 Tax=Nocardioides sp. ChNu-99 TaxID=2839897 RepID=UPI002405BD44|nr:phosphotransferase [Nocardioides sp. ChNu-99]MDF9717819.1 phosphotransferase [Nocardioides sp. ChNu-99]